MNAAEAKALLAQHGLRLTNRLDFLQGHAQVTPYAGAEGMTKREILAAHQAALSELQTRVRQSPGAFVIYDPNDAGEGWLIVGNDLGQMTRATMEAFDHG